MTKRRRGKRGDRHERMPGHGPGPCVVGSGADVRCRHRELSAGPERQVVGDEARPGISRPGTARRSPAAVPPIVWHSQTLGAPSGEDTAAGRPWRPRPVAASLISRRARGSEWSRRRSQNTGSSGTCTRPRW
ncbi:hypothetical protein ACFPM0_28310 [Pseudonocardia sulfidoxydans]|uniref:hypothetical protein n=1 Tax=Pseudonocardia sulfidoxydans TaxID=54011 RepID=UPI003613D8D6